MSLITFPACCIYWREAHKFSRSQLYRRHINVEARCCLISSPLRIRKWKCVAEKRANSLLLFALQPAEAHPSLSFILSFSRSLCLIFGRRARGSSEFSILSEISCDLSVFIRKKRSRRRENHIRARKRWMCHFLLPAAQRNRNKLRYLLWKQLYHDNKSILVFNRILIPFVPRVFKMTKTKLTNRNMLRQYFTSLWY